MNDPLDASFQYFIPLERMREGLEKNRIQSSPGDCTMLEAFLIINDGGAVRLAKFYNYQDFAQQQNLIRDLVNMLSNRDKKVSNVIEGEAGTKIVYCRHASLLFIMVINKLESEMAILEFLQTLINVINELFGKHREPDLVSNFNQLNGLVDEIIQGGLILQFHKSNIMAIIQNRNP